MPEKDEGLSAAQIVDGSFQTIHQVMRDLGPRADDPGGWAWENCLGQIELARSVTARYLGRPSLEKQPESER